MSFLSVLAFAIPFVLGHSQFLTGPLVNAALFMAAILSPTRFFLPVILFPGLAVLSRGLIFGPLTPFLVFFLPVIWVGNLTLVVIFQKTLTRLGYFPAALSAAVGKFLLLAFFAQLLFQIHLAPPLFLQTMGINQLLTALVGGVLAYPIYRPANHE